MVYAHTSQDGCPNCGSKKWVHSGVCDECVDCSRQICSECCACNVEGILTCNRCVDDLLGHDDDCTCAECISELLGEDDVPEPVCECVQIDVDLVDNRYCEVHGGRAPVYGGWA